MTDYQPLNYRLRCHSKRTDLPPDVLRDICEAYDLIHEGRQVSVTPTPRTDIAAMQGFIDNDFDGGLMPASVVSSKFSRKLEMEINQLRKERDEARRIAAYQYAKHSNYGDESFAMRNFFQFHKWEHLKEDGK